MHRVVHKMCNIISKTLLTLNRLPSNKFLHCKNTEVTYILDSKLPGFQWRTHDFSVGVDARGDKAKDKDNGLKSRKLGVRVRGGGKRPHPHQLGVL